MNKHENIDLLLERIKALRDPKTGCPWDLKQTHVSLLKYLIEESYEFKEAVLLNSDAEMKDELGDVLLQVVLHSQLAQERKAFNFDDVVKNISDKIYRRHPHVFSEKKPKISTEDVKIKWNEIKDEERKGIVKKTFPDKLLCAPALASAALIGVRSQEVDFDWNNAKEVFEKVEEELEEVKVEILEDPTSHKVEEEVGDLLFSVAQLARHLNINPEMALEHASRKFLRRFQEVEIKATKDNNELKDCSRSQKEAYWNLVKQEEKK